MALTLSTGLACNTTPTGIRIGGKLIKSRESLALALQPLGKGDRRRIRQALTADGKGGLATAGTKAAA